MISYLSMQSPDVTRLALIDATNDDSPAALRRAVRGVVVRILRESLDHPDVEDATHEALRRVVETRDKKPEHLETRVWAYGIARHVSLDVLRRRQRERSRAGAVPSHPEFWSELADDGPSPLEALEQKRRAEGLASLFATLPDREREALHRFHARSQSYQAIATAMNTSVGTVATWISRARRRIADQWSEGGHS